MMKVKKIFSISLFLLLFINETNAAIKDGLFATVGNKAITRSDIITEIKILLILNGKSFSEERKNQLESAAINSLIMRNIKKIEIEKYESLEFDKNDLNLELEKLASKLNIEVETFKNIFINNEIDFSYVTERLEVDLLWNSLIFSLYKNRLSINLDEIDQRLKTYDVKSEVIEYLISEIIIGLIPQNEIENTLKEIKTRIENEGFEKVAMDLSISETGVNGGDLGWISENLITDKFKNEITATTIGNISEPIFLPEGILFFKVRDKKKIEKKLDLEKVKDELVAAEKTKILHMQSLSHYDTLKRSIAINYF